MVGVAADTYDLTMHAFWDYFGGTSCLGSLQSMFCIRVCGWLPTCIVYIYSDGYYALLVVFILVHNSIQR